MELENIVAKLKEHTPDILGSKHFSKYAVMLPLIQKEDGIHILFETRSLQLRRQPGEICFPGGRIDQVDDHAKAAAIRETVEELGISEDEIQNVYPLDFMVSPFGMIVYPFVGLINHDGPLNPNPAEVEEIFSVPFSYFLKSEPDAFPIHFKIEPEEGFPFHLIPGGENYNWRTRKINEYFYMYEGKVIWGLTANILVHFIEFMR